MQHLVLLLLVPAACLPLAGSYQRDWRFWGSFVIAALASIMWTGHEFGLVSNSANWRTEFGSALWLVVAASLVLFLACSVTSRSLWKLGVLYAPYLFVLAVFALLWSSVESQTGLSANIPHALLGAHIAFSVTTYILITLAAVSGLAALLQARSLKQRSRSNTIISMLPPLAHCENLEFRFLGAGELILALGIVSGIFIQFLTFGTFVETDHKTVFSVAAFVLIGLLLLSRYRWGVRGRTGTRLVLLGYLFITLAYPGVKFVRDVLIA